MCLSDKKVAVFMTLYRNENTMHKAIQSIVSQTHSNLIFAIFVSDDTKNAVSEYAKNDSRILIVEGTVGIDNRSFFKLQAEILRNNNCEYMVRLDGDDWCDERYIEIMLDFAEKNKTDIVACGTYFVDNSGTKILDSRYQNDMIWNTRETTAEQLILAYRLYGTTWGKLIAADVVFNQRLDRIPDSEEYGAYGGDTIWVFNLLSGTKKLGICHNVLYYYRLSDNSGSKKTNHSNVLRENRLKSDEFLFYYIENVLKELGCLNTASRDFLLFIYATATQDTTELILRSNLSAEERAERLLYIYENSLTSEFLEKENSDEMAFAEGSGKRIYRDLFYNTVFGYAAGHIFSDFALNCYFKVFEIVNIKCRGKISLAEFALLIERKVFLDAFVEENYNMLFSLLLDTLPKLSDNRVETCMSFLKRLTNSVALQVALQDLLFTNCYSAIIKDWQKNEYESAFKRIHTVFSGKKKIRYAVKLAEFWSNLGAEKEDADEYILAKESLAEALIHEGNVTSALEEYNMLIELGVNDEKIHKLSKKINSINN